MTAPACVICGGAMPPDANKNGKTCSMPCALKLKKKWGQKWRGQKTAELSEFMKNSVAEKRGTKPVKVLYAGCAEMDEMSLASYRVYANAFEPGDRIFIHGVEVQHAKQERLMEV